VVGIFKPFDELLVQFSSIFSTPWPKLETGLNHTIVALVSWDIVIVISVVVGHLITDNMKKTSIEPNGLLICQFKSLKLRMKGKFFSE